MRESLFSEFPDCRLDRRCRRRALFSINGALRNVVSLAIALSALSATPKYMEWMATRLEKYCLADNSPGAIVQYFYLRVPQSIAELMDGAIREILGISPNVGRILYTMPYDCTPWSGKEP